MFTLIIKFSPVVTLILLCYSKTDFFRGVVQKFSLNSEYPYFSLQFFHLYQIQKKFKNFVIYPYKTLRSSFCIKLSARFQRLFKFARTISKIYHLGVSRAVQWLGLHLPMQRVQVQSLVRKLRFYMPLGQKTKT